MTHTADHSTKHHSQHSLGLLCCLSSLPSTSSSLPPLLSHSSSSSTTRRARTHTRAPPPRVRVRCAWWRLRSLPRYCHYTTALSRAGVGADDLLSRIRILNHLVTIMTFAKHIRAPTCSVVPPHCFCVWGYLAHTGGRQRHFTILLYPTTAAKFPS